jgi:hypothetical protein
LHSIHGFTIENQVPSVKVIIDTGTKHSSLRQSQEQLPQNGKALINSDKKVKMHQFGI